MGTVSHQRPSLSCNSDCTVNVRQPSMSCNSDATVCLNSQRASLSMISDSTVNVRQPSLGCMSDAVILPQTWDLLRKFSEGFSYDDDRLSIRTCESLNFSENKDLSDEQVGIIDKILLSTAPADYEDNIKRMSHYMSGVSDTLAPQRATHRRRTYCPSSLAKAEHRSSAQRQRFASCRSMNHDLAREIAMRLALAENAKGWTFADLFTMRN